MGRGGVGAVLLEDDVGEGEDGSAGDDGGGGRCGGEEEEGED